MFARLALLGTLAGVAVGVLAGLVLDSFLPPRFEASVVLFHTPGSGGSDSGRDFVAATLAQPELLPGVAQEPGLNTGAATALAGEIEVTAADASRPLAEIRLRGTDADVLARSLDAVAEHMVALHRRRQQANLETQLEKLDAALASAAAHLSNAGAGPADAAIPEGAAHDAIVAAARLARQRRELELGRRFSLGHGSTLDERRRELSLHGLERQLERAERALESEVRDPLARAAFGRARARALAAAEVDALQHIRDGLVRESDALSPLRIVRAAEVSPLSAEASPALLLAACGAMAGLFAGGFVWSANQSSPTRLSAQQIEKSLRVPVLAAIPGDLDDGRDHGPRAVTNPRHLAVAAVRSLRIALAVRLGAVEPPAPVVFGALGDPRPAALVVANLAVVAAHAGERVLVVDGLRNESGLAAMLSGGDDAMPYGAGAIRLAITEAAGGTAAIADGEVFDHVFVLVRDAPGIREYVSKNGSGSGVLVCAMDESVATLRKAQAHKLFGIVLSAYPLDEAAYSAAPEAPRAG